MEILRVLIILSKYSSYTTRKKTGVNRMKKKLKSHEHFMRPTEKDEFLNQGREGVLKWVYGQTDRDTQFL